MYRIITAFSLIAFTVFFAWRYLSLSPVAETSLPTDSPIKEAAAETSKKLFKSSFIDCVNAPEGAILQDDLPPLADFIRIDCMNIGHVVMPLKAKHLWLLNMRHIQDIVIPDSFLGLASPLPAGEVINSEEKAKGHEAHFTDVDAHLLNEAEVRIFLAEIPDFFKERRVDPSFNDIESITELTFTTSENKIMRMTYVKLKSMVRELLEKREFDAFGKVCWPRCEDYPVYFRHMSVKELTEPAFLKDIDQNTQDNIKKSMQKLLE